MEKPTRKVRAGQPITSDPLALHRIDGKYLEGSHARMVAGTYEQRPMPIDVAEPDAYDLRGQDYEDEQDDIGIGIGWLVFAVVCIVAFFAFGVYINW